MIPIKEYLKPDYSLHLCSAAFFSPICYNHMVDGCGKIDELVVMKPDRDTFKVLPWCPTQAAVLVNIYDHDGNPW
jgi:glutamine synthetase